MQSNMGIWATNDEGKKCQVRVAEQSLMTQSEQRTGNQSHTVCITQAGCRIGAWFSSTAWLWMVIFGTKTSQHL
jgi:hypothetical protein